VTARRPAARSSRPPTRRPGRAARRPARRAAQVRLADANRRLRFAVLVLAVALSLFGGRLIQLQGLDATAYAAQAEQHRIVKMDLPAARGAVTDRNGVALASTLDAVDITADQTLIVDPGATAAVLAPVLRIAQRTLEERLTGKRRFVYVARNVTPETWRKVRELSLPGTGGIPGIVSRPSSKRVYPSGAIGANLVGFVGADGHGLGGLELALDKTLAGKDGRVAFEFTAGRRLPAGTTYQVDPVPGRDVRLTIDRDIQWVAQEAIARKVKETGSESGTVIVMDPHTGDLLAVATAPTFDPNRPGAAPSADRGNRSLTEPYEPGSTGKVITAAALIEEGVVTPETPIDVPNRLKRGPKTFKDFKDHKLQHLTYAGTIAKSSNIGTILAAEKLGLPKLYPYLDKFGIGHPTGLGFPGEAAGRLPPVSTWSATSGYTMAFGQGYSVNTVQMASVFATLANDGVRVPPRLVDAVTGADGRLQQTPPSAGTRVVSAKTAQTVRLMMETVLGEGGTAPAARVPGYRVGGKTGTAQRFNPACGCYRGYTYSFIGLAPVDKPGLVVAVTLQDPKSGTGGGGTAGPVFSEVMSFALQSRRIPPTGTKPPGLRIERD
jgi:cell division protein FtsI (penicillin-binding protein 3)